VPRLARLDTPGTLHHVIVRGIEQRRIKDFPWQRQVVRWESPPRLCPRSSAGERVGQHSQQRYFPPSPIFPGAVGPSNLMAAHPNHPFQAIMDSMFTLEEAIIDITAIFMASPSRLKSTSAAGTLRRVQIRYANIRILFRNQQ
jgi:hypothetical protein